MAYDQHAAYQAPRRNYLDQGDRQQQAPTHYNQQGYGNSSNGYGAAAHPQPNHAAEQYGTFDPYAQEDNHAYGQQTDGRSTGIDYGQRGNQQQEYGHRQQAQSYGSQQSQKPARQATEYGGQEWPMNGSSTRYENYDQSRKPVRLGHIQANDQQYNTASSQQAQYGQRQQPQQQYDQRQPSNKQQYDTRSQQQLGGYGQADRQDHSKNLNGQRSNVYEQQTEERRYDPRYQQRAGRDDQHGGQQQAVYQSQHQQTAQQPYPNRDPYAAPSPVDARPAGSRQFAQDPRQAASQSNLRQQSSQQQLAPQKTAPKKMSMEEWKAQEKAKLHKDSERPETLPQDNAFPTFPTKKAEGSRAGGASAMSHRSGEEHTRPSTASSSRPDERRPGLSRDNSSQRDGAGSEHSRPSLDQKPSYFESGSARPSFDSVRRADQPERKGSPLNDQRQLQQARTQTPPQQARPPPIRKDSYNTARSSPQPSVRGNVPPINTAQTERPSTSDSRFARRPSQQQPMSPLGKYSQSAQDRAAQYEPRTSTDHGMAPPRANYQQYEPRTSSDSGISAPKPPYQQHNPQTSSLSDLYDGYYGGGKPSTNTASVASSVATSRQALTREEEIEAEMPDFDSAAPSQKLHKRNQTVDRHLHDAPSPGAPPPLPTMPPALPSSTSSNFDFGFSGHQQTDSQQVDQQFGLPVQPYANDYERRSMDDGRQLPYRDAQQARPPPQRFYGTQSSQSQTPRPGLDRNATAASAWSDPGQRAGSAPPQQYVNGYGMENGNPDALPAHPVPVRAGLGSGGADIGQRPTPVRQYGIDPRAQNATPAPQQKPALPEKQAPVTQAELNQLRAAVEQNPSSMSTALAYAKKLVEASSVLAGEGGRADPKTKAKNRERYIMDAYKRIKKLVSAGYPEAQFYLADCYGQGSLGLEVDTKEAFKLYQAAAKAGHGTAAYRTAVCCEMGAEEGGGTSRDYPKAVQWYRRAAALGETAAMFKVGMIALKGLLGQPRNLGEAATWLKRAAERADKDNPHALHELAVLYETANSTPELRHKIIPDDAYSLQLYRQAADVGYKYSQFRLGQCYEYGNLGLPIDHRASISWYSKAAAQGEHQAELALSGWYLTGAEGILEHSDTEAYLWARKAAQAEPPLAKAMFAMGYFLETGIGCAVNVEEAKRWYGRAASYKHPKALERLEVLKRGGKGGRNAAPMNGKLTRKDQKRDEAECAVM